MNCCDEYGNCNQGRDCPVRAARNSGVCSTEPDPVPEDVFWPAAKIAAAIGLAIAAAIGICTTGAKAIASVI